MASHKLCTLILFLSYPFHFPGLLELPPAPGHHASASFLLLRTALN